MNEQMEKLKEKNEEITATLLYNFTFHLVVTIFFLIVGVWFFSSGIRAQMVVLKSLCFIASLLCWVICGWLRNSYRLLIKSEMRKYKHYIDVAMHHRDKEIDKALQDLKNLEKAEENHIPKID